MKRLHTLVASAALLVATTSASAAYTVITREDGKLPVTAFNITFRVGSADDPQGKEGLAELTAALLREGGMGAFTLPDGKKMPALKREELEEVLFPLAAEIGTSAGREQVSYVVTTPAAAASKVFDLLSQMVLSPAWDEGEFQRLRAEALDETKKRGPREDQEELGKAALEWFMYGARHPYAHVPVGRTSALEKLTLDDVKTFYATHFTQARLTVAVAGVVGGGMKKIIAQRFRGLPAGGATRALVPEVAVAKGPRLLIVKGPFDAVGVHMGHPVTFNRGSPEFAEMYLASMTFGKHRSFVGRLMKNVREIRGLNYGTYSYVEEFPGGGHRLSEPTQAARTRQAFTVWGRPTPVENGCFLLRQIHREVLSLVAPKGGFSAAEFDLGKSHLVGTAPLLATSLQRRIGYDVDSQFYGIHGDYLKHLQNGAKRATRAKVAAQLRAHIKPDALSIVVVTPDPERFKKEILSEKCDIKYGEGIEKDAAVKAEDALIARHGLGLKAENISVVDSEEFYR